MSSSSKIWEIWHLIQGKKKKKKSLHPSHTISRVFTLFFQYVHIFKLEKLKCKNYIIKNHIWSGRNTNSFISEDFAVVVHFLKHIASGDAQNETK